MYELERFAEITRLQIKLTKAEAEIADYHNLINQYNLVISEVKHYDDVPDMAVRITARAKVKILNDCINDISKISNKYKKVK